MTGTPVVPGGELFDADRVDPVAGEAPQGLGAHRAQADHDGVGLDVCTHRRTVLTGAGMGEIGEKGGFAEAESRGPG
ncbi:hypothetical protein GCM10028793_43760 [Nocardiopsis oceani]